MRFLSCRTLRRSIVVVAVIGCHSYRPATRAPEAPDEIELRFAAPTQVRVIGRSYDTLEVPVTKIRGRIEQLHGDTAVFVVSLYWPPSGSALSALPVRPADGSWTVIPLRDASRVSIRKFSALKTVPLLVIAGIAVIFAAGLAILIHDCRSGCD